jgi:hypothetical protein
MTSQLILKRARTSRPSGQWKDEDYDVLADGKVVGRILEHMKLRTRRSTRRRFGCKRSVGLRLNYTWSFNGEPGPAGNAAVVLRNSCG